MDWKENSRKIDVAYNKDTSLICFEYPAIVQNTERAIESLGGRGNINKIHSDGTKRFPLCFRPEDVYCRPLYGDRHNTHNLLMRVRRRRKKTEGAEYEYRVEVLGLIQMTYKFQAMSDFQYLPVEKKDDGQYESIYDKIVLNKLCSHKEYFNRDAPLFMPPLMFSRVDTPCDFLVRPDIAHRKGYVDPDKTRAPNLIGTVREKRTIYTIFVNYGEPVPERPIEQAVKRLKSKYVNPDWEVQIRKLFEEKPIYLKVEIEDRLGYSKDKLKVVLPALCFYWLDGPWRAQWNRFGFDPTKNVEAKIYQTLDFRIRQFKPGQKVIKPKRGSVRYRFTQQIKNKPAPAKISLDNLSDTKDDSTASNRQDMETAYQFFPDKIPPQRLIYYQLGLIHLDEVQKLVHSNDGKETTCTERDGWCIKDVMDKCRDIMYSYIEKLLSTNETVQQSFAKRLEMKRRKYLDEEDGGSDGGGAATAAGGNDDSDNDEKDTGATEMDVEDG